MTEKVLVVSTESKLEAVHFEKDECATCTSGCAKLKNSFEISNPCKFEIKKGDVVLVTASRKSQAVQGILSLFVPFLCAVAGYVFSPAIMKIFGAEIQNDAKAVFVLLFLILSSAAVFAITRKHPMPGKPEIVEKI